MCDFSLQSVRSRPAQVGDKLVTHDFGTGTRGLADKYDCGTAVCVRPGTELGFKNSLKIMPTGVFRTIRSNDSGYTTAIFRQINKDKPAAHHDALEFPDGKTILLTLVVTGQEVSVLQLPATPTTEQEADEQQRVSYVG